MFFHICLFYKITMKRPDRERSDAVAAVFKALGHPTRVFIVEKLRESDHCVCELSAMIGADMSTVSRHLSILKAAGIVRDRKDGTTVYYSLACDCLSQMLAGVENIIGMRLRSQSAALGWERGSNSNTEMRNDDTDTGQRVPQVPNPGTERA
jgi:ArsR family transcriptional regulator